MLKSLSCLLLASALTFSLHGLAKQVIVKGTVKWSNGTPAAGRAVYIMPDSLQVPGCFISHTAYTNANGVYIDTLVCSNAIVKIRVRTEDCGGTWLLRDPQVSGEVAEVNFTLSCSPATVTNCEAVFKAVSTSSTALPATVQFNSSASHGSTATDSITERLWNWGDGSSLGGNVVNPSHTFTQAGNYTVCLSITTAKKCVSKACTTITIAKTEPPVTQCKAVFTWERLSLKKIRVNAGKSTKATGDSIIQRRWDFGDGTTLADNSLNPTHEYKQTGSYNVCLWIKTAKGCENSFCSVIKLGDSTTPAPAADAVKLVQLFPNPATTVLHAVIYSRYNNTPATLEIYDIYGALKWSAAKNLLQGDNASELQLQQLAPGPYVFRVTTTYGKINKNFYKL